MIRIGIIGCNYWGPNIVRNFHTLKSCQVETVADLVSENLKKIKKLYPEIKTTQNYKDILKDSQIEAVGVVTPAATHYSLIKECLSAEKHVFTEKPLALKVSQGKELIALAKRKRKVLMVGHTFEYSPPVRKMREILKRRELGKPLFIYSKRLSLGPIRSDVNVLWDFAFHDISILTYLLEKEPVWVSARGKYVLRKGIADFGFIELKFPNNITAQISVSWFYPKKERETVIIGSKKMLVYDDTNSKRPLAIYHHQGSNWLVKPKASFPKVKREEPLRIECQHFISCIRKKKIPLTDGQRGLKIITILAAVQKSLDSNSRLIKI